MTTLIENDSKEIIKILESTGRKTLDVFTNEDALEVMLEIISKQLLDRWIEKDLDINKEKDRKIIISRARSIASVSLRLDEIGKDEVAKLKELPKLVDAGRRQAREYFDTWKEETRKPVTEWEAKQEEVKLLAQIILDHEQAILDNVQFEVEKERVMRENITKEVMDEAINTLVTTGRVSLLDNKIVDPIDHDKIDAHHKIFVHKQLLAFFKDNSKQLSSDDAKQIITAIIKGKSPYIKIIY